MIQQIVRQDLPKSEILEETIRRLVAKTASEAIESFVAAEPPFEKQATLFLHYNEGSGRQKVRGWEEIVEAMSD